MPRRPAAVLAAGLALALSPVTRLPSRVMDELCPTTHAATLPGHDTAWMMAGTDGGADAEALATFTSKPWGLVVRYPAALKVSTTFKQSYFDRGEWRFSYAVGAGSGTPIVAFSLPDLHAEDAGGTSEATAEVTIGASRDPDVLANCLTYGTNSGNNVEQRTRTIGGISFTEVPDNTDTEMMKTIATDDFRAVRGGTCWAIDIVRYVGGTSERRPDYSPAQIETLRRVLDGITFE